MPAHKWKPITGLGDNPQSLTDRELDALQVVWAEQKKTLIENGTLKTVEDRLRREWSIETGIIERVYTLDRGTTRTLIERGIDATLIPHGASDRYSTDVARIIQDHYDALEEERFKLTVHTETRQEPVYELVLTKAGSKLKDVSFGVPRQEMRKGQLLVTSTRLSLVIPIFSALVQRPVIDKTGLAARA